MHTGPLSRGPSFLGNVLTFQQPQVRLHNFNGMAVQELLEMLVKMAIVVIPIGAEMKAAGLAGKMLHGLADPHDL